MIGAVMLLMAATVGITYGWTPDGGNGVKYIIQIPPEKMEQVARTGEISSQIPAEIRGHVSEVVIRVGNGNLPRVTPEQLSSRGAATGGLHTGAGNFNVVADADQIPMPIPSMGDPSDLRPIGTIGAAPTAMMKPAPQSGGMNMPGAFGTTAPSTSPPNTGYGSTGYNSTPPPSTGYNSGGLEQAAREAANSMAQQFSTTAEASRQQFQQNLNANVGRVGDAANAQFQSAANGVMYGPAIPPSSPDDPRSRLTQSGAPVRPPMTSSATANGSSAAPYASSTNFSGSTPNSSRSVSTSAPAGFATPPSFATSSPPNMGPSTTAGTVNNSPASTPPMNAPTRDEDWYAMNGGSRGRPSTAPTGNSAGAFASGNFGQLPGGLQSPTNSSTSRSSQTNANSGYSSSGYADGSKQTSATNNDLDYDHNLTSAQAEKLPRNGYSLDAEGYPVDRRGYRLDQYGRRVDRQGHLITAVDAMGDSNSNRGNTGDDSRSSGGFAGGTGFNNNRPSQNSSTPPLVQPPRDRSPGSGSERDGDSRLAGLTGGNGSDHRNTTNVGWNDGRSRPSEDDMDSSSDGQSRRDRFVDKANSLASGAGDSDVASEQVAAQPIFNALLLLSVVTNLYFLFWLKNLRVQFRDMVAAKRATAAGGSLAGGV